MRNLQNPIKQLADLVPLTGDQYSRKLSVREAASFYNVSKGWLDKRRVTGDGPRYIKIGRRVLYDVHDLEAWALSKRRQNTSESASD
jgi:predicted DNA-binding transcriptional regulator AlpA